MQKLLDGLFILLIIAVSSIVAIALRLSRLQLRRFEMVHQHKNLHNGASNLYASAVHVDRTQLEALDHSRGDAVYTKKVLTSCTSADTCHTSQPTSAIKEVL